MRKPTQLPRGEFSNASSANKSDSSRFAPDVASSLAPFQIPNSKFLLADKVRQTGGFALVFVLGIIVLLVVLIVGFVSSAGTQRAASAGFRASVSTRQLADTAVSLVQGQINIATTQGSAVAWASQPGMVRTFNNTNGNLINAYKLYSATEMIGNSLSFDASGKLTADYPPNTWAADSAIWTDLNAPVEVNGVKNFPILDPSSLGSAQAPQGFEITDAPGVNAYQSAPMPVRWLYVLSDGSVVAPTETTGKTATVPGAGSSNPIIGRVAFWTDDDTCKVNINTASEGTYWDTPRSATTQEYNFAKMQPVNNEFQRYAGHPATTSLTSVFPKPGVGYTDKTWAEQIYTLIPRVRAGGSNVGTTLTTTTNATIITPDSDRLYASLDELLFKPDRGVNAAGLSKSQLEQTKFFLTARSRAPETNLFNLPRVAMWPVYRLGLNGTPASAYTTAFDRLIAFCASSGPVGSSTYRPYIFQRGNANSTTADISLPRNGELLSYLSYLTRQATPGFGGSFATKYPLDSEQILTETFDYIRSVNLQDNAVTLAANRYTPAGTGSGWVVPSQRGTGGNQTMGFGRCYTLSEISLAFICNAAPDDPATAPVDESYGSNVPTIGNPGRNSVLGGSSTTNGTALMPGEKYIQAMILPQLFSPALGFTIMFPDMQMKISGLPNLQINGQSLFPTATDTASASFTSASASYEYSRMGGFPTYRFFGLNRGSPARGNLAGDSGAVYPFFGTPIKISAPTTGGTMTFTGGTITVQLYSGAAGTPTASNLIQTFTITFPDSTFPVPEIVPNGLSGTGGNAPLLNTARNWWSFSKVGCITPSVSGNSTSYGTMGRLGMIQERCFANDQQSSALFPASTSSYWTGTFFRPEYDTIRSMQPSHGDYRLVAASPVVTGFVKHRYYDDATRRVAANMPYLRQASFPGNDRSGKYIAAVTYNQNGIPNIPSNATDTPEGTGAPGAPKKATGDFDRGVTTVPDGPYINKPDEGDIVSAPKIPYFEATLNANLYVPVGVTFFSPNRQIPSSGMLGSLSTGVKENVPWRTLLFRPQATHPSYSTTIPDHLLMDLFWMPVVEPYPISDRFSTAGKINMNYQILPFTYITRSTGLMAVLKPELLAAIPNSRGPLYAGDVTLAQGDPTGNTTYRLPIDGNQTLSQFKAKFDQGGIFKSASEICDIHIVPTGKTVAQMADTTSSGFWATNALTGDNLRERIYTTLYPRLTTKSNTFTVHVRVQALQQVPTSTAGTWTEGKDRILGEYRGATSLERFIDANNPLIPDYAATPANIPNMDSLDKFYRWRIVENRQFAP